MRVCYSFRWRLGSFFGLVFVLLALAAQANAQSPESPITKLERLRWFVNSTVGPTSLGVGIVSSGWGTWMDKPGEYGTHWAGSAKRYGMRLSGVSAGNAIEAGLGIATNEDPRYFPSVGNGSWQRVRHAAAMTLMAHRSDGRITPAYARYAGIVGNNFLSNAWRAPSESTVNSALIRTGLGFTGRFVSNLFDEFRGDFLRRKGFSTK